MRLFPLVLLLASCLAPSLGHSQKLPLAPAAVVAPATPEVPQAAPLTAIEVAPPRQQLQPAPFGFEGMASWYGPKFAGRKTANGEIFDPWQLTAAHLTLPFDSQLKVTNLMNGQSVVVRINDRGPFVGNRIIDLSQGAADAIGMIQHGVARVRLEPVTAENTPSLVQPFASLANYDIISPYHERGQLLQLRSATNDQTVIVRVVGQSLPAGFRAHLATSSWISEHLGSEVFIVTP